MVKCGTPYYDNPALISLSSCQICLCSTQCHHIQGLSGEYMEVNSAQKHCEGEHMTYIPPCTTAFKSPLLLNVLHHFI